MEDAGGSPPDFVLGSPVEADAPLRTLEIPDFLFQGGRIEQPAERQVDHLGHFSGGRAKLRTPWRVGDERRQRVVAGDDQLWLQSPPDGEVGRINAKLLLGLAQG